MKARGEFVFKGIEKRSAGSFVDGNGKTVDYKEKTILKVDEVVEGSINERKLTVDTSNLGLIDRLKKLEPYSKFILECDIVLYQNGAKVVPIAICDSNNKSKEW